MYISIYLYLTGELLHHVEPADGEPAPLPGQGVQHRVFYYQQRQELYSESKVS